MLILAATVFFFTEESAEEHVQPAPAEIKIVLVGDIMLDRGVKYMINKKGENDFKFPFLKIADYLKKADIVFGNLEGPISDKGEKIGSIYSFRTEPEAIKGLAYAGFNVLSLANNHALDYGHEALEDTLLRLKLAQIDYVGAGFSEKEAFSPIIKEVKGTKIGFLAFTNLGPETWQAIGDNSGIAWTSSTVSNLVKNAKEKADILIVSLHWGEEYLKEPAEFQISFAKETINAGADLIVGHHSHVVQPNEKYKEGYIFYGLGNFVFDQGFSKETMEGLLLEIIVENKEIKEINPKEIKINGFFQPSLIP